MERVRRLRFGEIVAKDVDANVQPQQLQRVVRGVEEYQAGDGEGDDEGDGGDGIDRQRLRVDHIEQKGRAEAEELRERADRLKIIDAVREVRPRVDLKNDEEDEEPHERLRVHRVRQQHHEHRLQAFPEQQDGRPVPLRTLDAHHDEGVRLLPPLNVKVVIT